MNYSDVLLTVDFDRTLTAPDSTIPRRNIEAIQYFIDNGGAFTVNTGRSLPMARFFMDRVPVSAPLILYNGSALYDIKKQEFSKVYAIDLDPADTIKKIIRMCPDLTVELQGTDAHYTFRKNPGWEAFSDYSGCAWAYTDPDHTPAPFLKFSLYGTFTDRTVSCMYSATPGELERMEQVIGQLKQTFGDKIEVFHPCPKIIDIHARGVSKCRAARDLQKAMGRKVLVCAGDAANDIPMLEGADYAFCPADGLVADQFPNVCKCGDGAIADVIYEKIPEISK